MSSNKKPTIANVSNDRPSSAPGDAVPELVEYKKKMHLPQWNDLSKELEELSKRQDVSWAAEVQAKVELHRKYLELQSVLVQNYMSMGLQHVNAVQNFVDLQVKLFELEQQIKAEGGNPLENDAWVRARDLLSKELQFIHKHGLDQAKFQNDLQAKKQKMGDDAMFVVEAEVE
jgi:hypothetical protein